MKFWFHFLDSLSSDGGHIIVLIGLLAFGVILDLKTDQEMTAHEIIAGAFAALMYSMRSNGKNGEVGK